MKKVLFFINSFSGGGAERVCLNMAFQLYKMNYECHFITLYKASDDYKVPNYISNLCIDIDKNASPVKRLLQMFRSITTINKYLKQHTYDLITAHLPMAHILASLTCVRKKTLYVMHNAQWPLNTNNSRLYFIKIKSFYKNKKVVTVSNGIKEELINEYDLDRESVYCIYNPISIGEIASVKRNENIYPRPYVISVGRLSYPKRPDIVINLYAKSKLVQNYDLVILGQGEYLEKLKTQVKDLGLENRIYFAGFQNNPYEWIKGAELMLSISDSEAMPMNIIEALASETKVVAANCKYGPDEILVGKLSLYLINPQTDFEESISVIEKALEDYPKELYTFVEKFDSDRIINLYIKLWKDIFVN